MSINLRPWHMCDFKSRGFSNAANGRNRRDSAVSSSRGRLFLFIPAISQRCPNAPGGWLRSFDLRAVMQGVYGRQLRASCFVGLSRASTKIDWNS